MRPLLADAFALSIQIGVIIALGGLMLTLSRKLPAAIRFAALRLLLVLCLALPVLAPRRPAAGGVAVTSMVLTTAPDAGSPAPADAPWTNAGDIVAAVLIVGVLVRLTMLVLALRRLRASTATGTPATIDDGLQAALGTSADVRYVDGVDHPVTFGFWRPKVLLPPDLARQSDDVRRAVLCHELLHVRRHDWAWLVAEEVLRAVFWFHPAVRWAISRLQDAREEVIDALVVATTGQRRAYMEALLAFSTTATSRPAPAFSPRHHLVRRLELIAKEAAMSPVRIALACIAFTGVVASGSWFVVHAVPLQTPVTGAVGRMEATAQPITPENPIPRRSVNVLPRYPDALRADRIAFVITLNITVDASGRVAEHRVLSPTFANLDPSRRSRQHELRSAFENAAADAIRQWQYDPPAHAPIAFPITFQFMPQGVVEFTTAAATDRTTPEWHAGAIRVGNGLAPPEKLVDVRPEYPLEAKAAGTAGVVILEIRIEPDGRVSNARTMRSIPALDQAAIDAVSQWRFRPALMNGQPAAVVMMVTVNFTLG